MLLRIFMAFLATGAFSILFKTPRKLLFFAALTGGIGWAVYEIVFAWFGLENAIIASAVVIGFVANIFAKLFKTNPHPFLTAGIIPLVPGAPAFFALRRFMEKNTAESSYFLYVTLVSAFGIVIGIAISSTISKYIGEQHSLRKLKREVMKHDKKLKI